MTGYPPLNYGYFQNIGTGGNVSCRESGYGFSFATAMTNANRRLFVIGNSWGVTDAHTVRCIQENE